MPSPRRRLRRFAMDDFEVLQKIGEGSFGVALRALYRPRNHIVVLKQLKMFGMSEKERKEARKEIEVRSSVHMRRLSERGNASTTGESHFANHPRVAMHGGEMSSLLLVRRRCLAVPRIVRGDWG